MSFAQFRELVSQTTDLADYPLAAAVEQNTLIYDPATLLAADRAAVLAELDRAFDTGPGIVAIRNAFANHAVLNEATALFESMIEAERATAKGDHFAKPGSNDRVWNALQKHALQAPANYCAYYASPVMDLVCLAWLGDGYQVTAQVNRVNPGGQAQVAHRDYHLGFMSTERMAKFPAAVHRLSPRLTLQGAIAHCDMPLETGPTLYLPYSQQYEQGYVAFGQPEFQDYFANNLTQLPLSIGDAVFFNPAVMHGAGTNRTTDRFRLANLVQISSAFGRAMETVDRATICKAIYPTLRGLEGMTQQAVINASAEGYAFPTNLDSDPPVGGMAPQTQAELLRQALNETWSAEALNAAIDAQNARRQA